MKKNKMKNKSINLNSGNSENFIASENNFKNDIKNRKDLLKILLSSSLSLLIFSCSGTNSNPPKNTPTSGLSSDILEQLDKTNNSNNKTAQNAINQSQVIYGQIVPKLTSISIDVEAFSEVQEKLLPPMLIIANSLTSSSTSEAEKKSITDSFKDIYSNTLANMLRGINNNLLIYQSSLEVNQSNNTLINEDSLKNTITDEGINTLANIFQATESTLFFVGQLGQFTTIFPNEDTTKILSGIKNQQTTIINGLINFTSQNIVSKSQAKNAYFIIAKSLTNPNLLSSLGSIALNVFGKENVAFNQDQITTSQSNPNLIVMVIKEDNSTYRKIRIENGKVINQVSSDNRDLSASDLLNQSNVNIIKVEK